MEVPTFMAAIAFHRGDFPELHEQGEQTLTLSTPTSYHEF
jgi:hypothetical protein